MFYITNLGFAHVYSISYELTWMLRIKIKRYQESFNPFVNLNKRLIISIYVINVFYQLGFIYVVFLVARNFSHHFLDLLKSKKFSFEWIDWVDLIVLLMSFIS